MNNLTAFAETEDGFGPNINIQMYKLNMQ